MGNQDTDWPDRANQQLRTTLESNRSAGILASENKVIERLLGDSAEMKPAWMSIGKALNNKRHFSKVIEIIVSTAAFHSPAKIGDHREALRRAVELNNEISKKAGELADLLDKQFALKEGQSISLRVSNNPVECMEQWARVFEHNSDYDTARRTYLFRSGVAQGLSALSKQYDLKYWPTVSDLLRGMEYAAAEAYAESYDPLCLAALESRESSNLDFVRALLAALEFAKKYEGLPAGFRFNPKTLTAITNCAGGLVEDACTVEAIKKAMQRIEKGTSSA